MTTSRKQRSKAPSNECPFDPAGEDVENVIERSDEHRPRHCWLVEAYAQGGVRIEVTGWLDPVEVEPRYWVAIFERVETQSDPGWLSP